MEKFETPPDSPPVIVIDPDDQPINFRIKSTHMQMIRDNQFDGRIRFDPHRHIADFLEISNLFQYVENQEEAVMLRTFPFSLSGEAKTCSDDPTQGILDAGGIFLYNTPNEAFKILEDKVLLKLDFSDDSQNLKPQTVVSAGGSNINSGHAILVDKFETLARKINSKFLIISKELKEMRDGHKDNHASQIYMNDDTQMCDPMEADYV
ncbi:hypothetical protein Tco_0871393 [Tanacetum coccineum]